VLRRRSPLVQVCLALLVVAASGCGGDEDPGDERAGQVRTAALDAGLDGDVADFLALAARGQSATYQVTYPGPDERSELVVANDPPNRRVDVVVDERVVEVQLVLDGEAFQCTRASDADGISSCERTDAVVDAPGLFSERSLTEVTESLRDRADDFTFRVQTVPVAGVEATCLVTEIREGRARSDLGSTGTICVSAEGALLKVDRDGETLEAREYTTEVPDNSFVRPDQQS